MNGDASAAASTAATANPATNRSRRPGVTAAKMNGAAHSAPIAKVTPPTKVELSKPATIVNASVASNSGLCRRATKLISTHSGHDA